MIRMRRRMRRPLSNSFLQPPLIAGLLLLCLDLIPFPVRRTNSNSPSLPWPCLFASASSITHRVASSISQSSSCSSSIFAAESTVASSSRELQNNNANNGQGAVKTDDSVDYAWMEGVNFNEASIMPVSCVN